MTHLEHDELPWKHRVKRKSEEAKNRFWGTMKATEGIAKMALALIPLGVAVWWRREIIAMDDVPRAVLLLAFMGFMAWPIIEGWLVFADAMGTLAKRIEPTATGSSRFARLEEIEQSGLTERDYESFYAGIYDGR